MQDRIRFEMAIHITARVIILFLSKILIRGDILNNNGFLYAILNRCGNSVVPSELEEKSK